jgi:hypothetical protein
MIKIIQPLNWHIIKQAALTTVGLKSSKPVTSEWKKKALISGHSINYFSEMVIIADMQYKTANHFVRHNKTKGFYANFTTQREDITNKKRDPDEMVQIIIKANPNAIIEVSHERLCNRTAKETKITWTNILGQIKNNEFELWNLCVKKCVQQGYCSEKFKPCGYDKTRDFKLNRDEFLDYVKGC